MPAFVHPRTAPVGLALIASAFGPAALAEPWHDEIRDALPGVIERVMSDEVVVGATVVVVHDGETVFKGGYGVADARNQRPVDPDRTIFRIGSVSKAMTCWALARLVDTDRIALDDPVSQYVPEIDTIMNVSGSQDPVLIRHVLTHTGGFDQVGPGRQVGPMEEPAETRVDRRRSLEGFLFEDGYLRRTSPPGLFYRYDTYGSTLAGLILERVTGKPYGEAMREALFEPAGMGRAGVGLSRLDDPDMAWGHGHENGQLYLVPFEVYNTTPASSVEASASDMESLMRAITGGVGNDGATPYSDAMRGALMSPMFRPHPEFAGMTFGMQEFERAAGRDGALVRAIGHGGSLLGFGTSLMFLPDHDVGIFVVANRNREAGGGRVTLADRVTEMVVDAVAPDAPDGHEVPGLIDGFDCGHYAGTYTYNVFCQTCTEEEFEAGGWRAFSFLEVASLGNTIRVRDIVYRPVADSGVFVSEDGRRRLFFNPGADGSVVSVSFAGSPDTFERNTD